jgi:hypothetical protein
VEDIVVIGTVIQGTPNQVEIEYSTADGFASIRLARYMAARLESITNNRVAVLIRFDESTERVKATHRFLTSEYPPLFLTDEELSIVKAMEHGEEIPTYAASKNDNFPHGFIINDN